MSTQLKNCPFCGSSSLDDTSVDRSGPKPYYYVFCNNCDAAGPCEYTQPKAVEKWNIRKEHVNE